MKSIINWIERNQQTCVYKKHLGFDCPGCGMQTAFVELLKGNFIESIKIYPALIPIILLFVFLALHLVFRFKKGGVFVKYWFAFTIVVVILSYILKICCW